MKSCTRLNCKQANPQPLTNFPNYKKSKDGLSKWCRLCHAEHHREWQRNNKEKVNTYARTFYANNRDKINTRNKIYHRKNVDKAKNRNLKKKFGVSLEQYNQLLKDQKEVCSVCKEKETAIDRRSGLPRKLAVDHCHSTGKIRGLLCGKCNQMIGLANDKPSILDRASEYLATSISS